ncbi:MAG TPA: twin-arginine translocase TatA/TatE family subunit [Pirellulales bacterium]|jgi:sec-independent protein translocase protein TatA|nr:twin-arginine translocase TatA/TatE family subunit [Pirellulales bacterium]
MNPLFANLFAGYDMLIVLVVVFLLFGNRLPSVMRNLGRGVTEFKKGVAGIEDQSEEDDLAPAPKPKKEEAPVKE